MASDHARSGPAPAAGWWAVRAGPGGERGARDRRVRGASQGFHNALETTWRARRRRRRIRSKKRAQRRALHREAKVFTTPWKPPGGPGAVRASGAKGAVIR